MNQINEQYAITVGENKNGQEVTVLYKTHIQMGNNNYIKLDDPTYLKSWYFTPNDAISKRVTQEEINHEILLNDWSRWNTELRQGDPVEVSEAIYYDMLGALPPINSDGNYFEVGEPHHHDNNGKPIHRAFWQDGDKYLTGYPKN